jgi:hypothetical protein
MIMNKIKGKHIQYHNNASATAQGRNQLVNWLGLKPILLFGEETNICRLIVHFEEEHRAGIAWIHMHTQFFFLLKIQVNRHNSVPPCHRRRSPPNAASAGMAPIR